MTRKDYVLIAAAIRSAHDNAGIPSSVGERVRREGIALAAHAVASALATDNPRFDRGRFLKAAGVDYIDVSHLSLPPARDFRVSVPDA